MRASSGFMYVGSTNHPAFPVCLRRLEDRPYCRLLNSVFKQKMILGCWVEVIEVSRGVNEVFKTQRLLLPPPDDLLLIPFLLLVLPSLQLQHVLFLRGSQSYWEKGITWKRHQSSVLASYGTLCMSDDGEVIVPLLSCIPFSWLWLCPA